MKMNKEYVTPQFSVLLVSVRDVITASVDGDDNIETDVF